MAKKRVRRKFLPAPSWDETLNCWRIDVGKGREALFDECDYERVVNKFWTYIKGSGGYASNVFHGFMHRYIMGAEKAGENPGVFIDHKNGNRLDNRRSNLRWATPAENVRNSGPRYNNTSGYKGVVWNKRIRRWKIQIQYTVGGKVVSKSYGHRECKHEAAERYNEVARQVHGEFAYQNVIKREG